MGAYLGFLSPLRSPLVGILLIPVWFPGMVGLACAAIDRATRYVRIEPITDDAAIVIRAHPRFAEAVAAQGLP